MKKTISLLLALVLCLSLCACGAEKSPETTKAPTTEATEPPTESVNKQALGDTVSTDIIELTVKKAALAYYAEGASTSTSDGRTTNVDSACEPAENGGLYKCNKGHTLVCLDFVLKNTDRGNLDTGNYIVSFTVRQGENEGYVFGYDLNNPNGLGGLNLYLMPVALNGGDFKTNKTSNKILSPGEYAEIKWVGVANFEPDSINDSFDLVVSIMSSSGNEEFVFTVE